MDPRGLGRSPLSDRLTAGGRDSRIRNLWPFSTPSSGQAVSNSHCAGTGAHGRGLARAMLTAQLVLHRA